MTVEKEHKYGFTIEGVEDYISKNKFLINTFQSIGITDPFPDDLILQEQDIQLHANSEITIDNLVYPKARYAKGQSPLMIYIPSKQIMLKIIRACIGCNIVEEIWLNRDETIPSESPAEKKVNWAERPKNNYNKDKKQKIYL